MKYLKSFFGAIDVRDYILFAGLGLLSYGLSLVNLPIAFIAPGVVLVYVAVFGIKR